MEVKINSNSYVIKGNDRTIIVEEEIEIPREFKVRIWNKELNVVVFAPIIDNGKLLVPFKLGKSDHKLVTAKYFISTYLKYRL